MFRALGANRPNAPATDLETVDMLNATTLLAARTPLGHKIRQISGFCALVALAACGAAAAPDAADTAASDVGASDTGPTDAVVAIDTQAADTGVAPGPDVKPTPEVVANTKKCSESMACYLDCPPPKSDGGVCTAACYFAASQTGKDSVKAIGDCMTAKCDDQTDPHARVACGWSKCFDKISACGEYGKGTANCVDTARCAGRCVLGDVACNTACLQNGAAAEIENYKDLRACFEGKCAGGKLEEMSPCILANCVTAAQACANKDQAVDCIGESACQAKCPAVIPNQPNNCAGWCGVLASEGGGKGYAAYQACKTAKCGAVQPSQQFACWKEKCSAEQGACFPATGASSCLDVYTCVKANCQGIGGDAKCIADCYATGTSPAKDAWVAFEGCITVVLETKKAKDFGCVSFPYDEASCINQIKGFCDSAVNACFKPQ